MKRKLVHWREITLFPLWKSGMYWKTINEWSTTVFIIVIHIFVRKKDTSKSKASSLAHLMTTNLSTNNSRPSVWPLRMIIPALKVSFTPVIVAQSFALVITPLSLMPLKEILISFGDYFLPSFLQVNGGFCHVTESWESLRTSLRDQAEICPR